MADRIQQGDDWVIFFFVDCLVCTHSYISLFKLNINCSTLLGTVTGHHFYCFSISFTISI